MQGKGINLNKLYKEIRKNAYNEPLTPEIIADFERKLNNAIDAGRLSELQKKTQLKHLEELKKYEGSKMKSSKKVLVTALGATALAGIIAAASVSCGRNKAENREYTIEETTEDETKNDFNNDTTEKVENENLSNIENDAKELVNALVERGYEIDDKETFVKKIVEGRIALSIDSLSPYKEISQLLTSGNINAKDSAIEMQNLIPIVFKTVMVSNKNVDWSLLGVNDATSKFLNEYTDKLLNIKNASTVEERQSLVTDLQNFLTDYQKIAIDSNESYDSTDLYTMHTTVLYGDELVKSATNLSQFVGTDVSKFINSLPCDKPVFIEEFDYTNASDLKVENITNKNLGIDVRADQFNDTVKNLSASFESAEKMIVNGTITDSEYGYGKIVSRISAQIKENENQKNVESSYDSIINSLRNQLSEYISSKSNVNTIGENDHSVTDSKGNTYTLTDETIKNAGATNQKEYEQAIKDKTGSELSKNNTFTDKDGNDIAKGDDTHVEQAANKYSADYTKGSAAGATIGYADGYYNNAYNPNVSGTEGYKAGYRDSYIENYNKGKKNRTATPETKVEYETTTPKKESETITEQKKAETVKAYETETTVSSNVPSYDFDYSKYGDNFEPLEDGPIDMGEDVVISSGKVR